MGGNTPPEVNVLIPMKGGRPMKHLCPALLAVLAGVFLTVPAWARGQDGPAIEVSLSLTKHTAVHHTDPGSTVGVKPDVIHVHVGDRIVFVNDDDDHHTATSLLNAATFIDDPRWTDDALRPSGAIGPGFWSTGDLAPGQRSQPLVAKTPGTYLYGCFFDYSAGMRGEIVVEP